MYARSIVKFDLVKSEVLENLSLEVGHRLVSVLSCDGILGSSENNRMCQVTY